MRELDHPHAERLVKAIRALSDVELLAAARPLEDVRSVLDKTIPGITWVGNNPDLPRELPTIVENPRVLELYDAVGDWMLGELDYRADILRGLDEGKPV